MMRVSGMKRHLTATADDRDVRLHTIRTKAKPRMKQPIANRKPHQQAFANAEASASRATVSLPRLNFLNKPLEDED